MIVSINQPAYLPWLGYFDRIHMSDIHIVLDHVQYEKNSMINRNKVRTKQDWTWLTVPVKTKGNFGDLAINKLKIDGAQAWAKKHFNTICFSYSKSKYFSQYIDFFEHIYKEKEWSSISSIIREINNYILCELKIKTEIIYSSDLDINTSKSQLLIDICNRFAATTYVSGPLGRDYLDDKLFSEKNMDVIYHDYQHPKYEQVYDKFVSHMSIIDLMFNCGDNSLEILLNRGIKSYGK